MLKITKVPKPEKKKSARQIKKEKYLAENEALLAKTKKVLELIEEYFSERSLTEYSATRWYANIPLSSKNCLGILTFGQQVFAIRKKVWRPNSGSFDNTRTKKIAEFALISSGIDINVTEENQNIIVDLAQKIEKSMNITVQVVIYPTKLPLTINGDIEGIHMSINDFADKKAPKNGLNGS